MGSHYKVQRKVVLNWDLTDRVGLASTNYLTLAEVHMFYVDMIDAIFTMCGRKPD